jgi:hypothetical protein
MPETISTPTRLRLAPWLFWSLFGLIVLFAIYIIIGHSQAFSDCVHAHKHTKEYQSLYASNGILGGEFVRARTRLLLNYMCTWEFTDKNNGAIVALATIALSFFTATLWRATTRLWQTSQDQVRYAERAIKSAEESAERQSSDLNRSIAVTERQVAVAERQVSTYEDSVKRVERGYLFVTEIESTVAPHLIPAATVGGLPSPSIRVVVKNYGRTPINIFSCAIFVEPNASPPEIPKQAELASNKTFPSEMIFIIVGPDKEYKFPEIGSVGFSEKRDELRSGVLSLYCYGYLAYRDIFMDRHDSAFCRRYDPARHEFVPDGGDERNYNT